MKSKGRLAIVGASVRAATQSALRAGFEVIGADLFADADLDGVCSITRIENYPDALADWLASQAVDAWIYTGAMENYPGLIDRMAQIAPLWGVSGGALRRCRDPLVLQQVFRTAVVAFPETHALTERSSDQPGWLAKTYQHSMGMGVWRLDGSADWHRAVELGAVAQRFVPGQSMTAVFAIGKNTASLLGVTEQRVSDEWSYVGSRGPIEVALPYQQQLSRLGDVLRGSLGLRGLVGVDMIVDEDTIWVVEINPRYTASVEVLERAAGNSAIAAHAAACRGEPLPAWSESTQEITKQIVFATEPATITSGIAAWLQNEQRAGRLADRPRVGERIEAGAPICTLFSDGKGLKEAEQALRLQLVTGDR